MSRQLKECWRE